MINTQELQATSVLISLEPDELIFTGNYFGASIAYQTNSFPTNHIEW